MKRPILPTILLVAAASAALAFTAGRAAPPQPVIAFVDMQRVIEGLDEKAARIQEVQDFAAKLATDLATESKRIEEDTEAAKLLPEGPERKRKAEEIGRRDVLLRANKEVSTRLLQMRETQALHDLYTKADRAAAEIAKARGYTIVFATDENVSIPSDNMDAFQRTAALKRALYVDPRHDITDELITYLNNQYAAAGGKPAPKPAAGR